MRGLITFTAALEFKAAHLAEKGEFTGYGAVFNNTDQAGDLILPGAFSATIAEWKAGGRPMPMHLNHGLPELGGVRGVGVWSEVAEDGRGLTCKGRISGMNTDAGRLLFERVRDGAIAGLSIGFKVAPGGADFPERKSAADPRRVIRVARLSEVSLVDDPCNPEALVDEVKAKLADGKMPTVEELARSLEALGFEPDRARAVAKRGLDGLEDRAGYVVADALVRELRREIDEFSLPTF